MLPSPALSLLATLAVATAAALPGQINRQNPVAWADKVENVEDLIAYAERGQAAQPVASAEPAPRFGALDEYVASKAFKVIYAPIPGAGAAEFERLLRKTAEKAGADEVGTKTGLQPRQIERRRQRGDFVFSFIRHPRPLFAYPGVLPKTFSHLRTSWLSILDACL